LSQEATEEELHAKFRSLTFKHAVLPLLINSARKSGYKDPEALVQTFLDNAQNRTRVLEIGNSPGRAPTGIFTHAHTQRERERERERERQTDTHTHTHRSLKSDARSAGAGWARGDCSCG